MSCREYCAPQNAHSCALALPPLLLHVTDGRPPKSGVSLGSWCEPEISKGDDVCVPGKKEGELEGAFSVIAGSTNEVLRRKCHRWTDFRKKLRNVSITKRDHASSSSIASLSICSRVLLVATL